MFRHMPPSVGAAGSCRPVTVARQPLSLRGHHLREALPAEPEAVVLLRRDPVDRALADVDPAEQPAVRADRDLDVDVLDPDPLRDLQLRRRARASAPITSSSPGWRQECPTRRGGRTAPRARRHSSSVELAAARRRARPRGAAASSRRRSARSRRACAAARRARPAPRARRAPPRPRRRGRRRRSRSPACRASRRTRRCSARVVSRSPVARAVPGEQAARERAPRDHADALVDALRDHLPLLLAVDEVVVVLHRDEARPAVRVGDALRLRELPRVHAARADVARLAGAHDVVQRLHRLLDRRPVVPAVDLVEVDVVEAEPARATRRSRRGCACGRGRAPFSPGIVWPCTFVATTYSSRAEELARAGGPVSTSLSPPL